MDGCLMWGRHRELKRALTKHNLEMAWKFHTLHEQGEKILSALDDLKTDTADLLTTVAKAEAVLDGLAAKLDAAIASGNPAALTQLSTDIKAASADLASHIAADDRP